MSGRVDRSGADFMNMRQMGQKAHSGQGQNAHDGPFAPGMGVLPHKHKMAHQHLIKSTNITAIITTSHIDYDTSTKIPFTCTYLLWFECKCTTLLHLTGSGIHTGFIRHCTENVFFQNRLLQRSVSKSSIINLNTPSVCLKYCSTSGFPSSKIWMCHVCTFVPPFSKDQPNHWILDLIAYQPM